jgi:hypothetical protein
VVCVHHAKVPVKTKDKRNSTGDTRKWYKVRKHKEKVESPLYTPSGCGPTCQQETATSPMHIL